MRQVSLFVPGRFEDAYLYMGWLLILTAERSLRTVRLDDVVSSIITAAPQSAHVAKMMFSNNQWIGDSQFNSWLSDQAVARELLNEFEHFPSPHFELSLQHLPIGEHDLKIDARVCLDLLIYNQRLFVCTESGLYGGDLDFESVPSSSQQMERRLDARCISVNARYGALSVSCGDDGLWGSPMEFDGFANQSMKKIEDRSLKARWLDYDLVNYRSYSEPQLLTNSLKKGEGSEGERKVITEMATEHLDLSFLIEHLHQTFNIERTSIQYIFNSNKVMFVHTVGGEFFSLGLRRSGEGGQRRIQFTRTYKGANTRILSASVSRVGVVVETDDRVLLFAEGDWHPLLQAPVVGIRTFPYSKRFQNVVTMVGEDGLYIVSLLNEPQVPVFGL